MYQARCQALCGCQSGTHRSMTTTSWEHWGPKEGPACWALFLGNRQFMTDRSCPQELTLWREGMRDHHINKINPGAGKCSGHRVMRGWLLSEAGSGKARKTVLKLRPGCWEGSQEKAWGKETQKQKPCNGKGLDLSRQKQGQGGQSPVDKAGRGWTDWTWGWRGVGRAGRVLPSWQGVRILFQVSEESIRRFWREELRSSNLCF